METKEQIEGDKNKEIEYTYDKQGNLVQVKSSLENEKAQYVQYVYDEQGNKVRRFTGMTGPLTVTVAAVENAKDDAGKDTFTYGGKTYAVLVTGKKKSDTIRETKYVYDTKNRLVSYTDPEGRTETYTYDCNSNLTKTVDKNGNTLKNTYDNKNRLTERTAKEKKTGKETVHTYRYNAYGDVAVQDDTRFVYGDVSGQVTKETTKLTKNKDVVKNYTYDSKGNKSTFSVKAGEDTKLSLSYEYDGSSRLISVKDSEGNRAVSYAYDTEGSLSERQAANGLKTTYGYDYQNRLTSMTNETGKGVVSKYSSTYLKNGQKAEEVSTVMDKNGKSTKKTAAYTYDMLGRITKETKTGREDISYTYDANNNRKQMTIGNKTTAYQYNKNDELLRTDTLHTDTEKNDVVIYKNDKNGNQLAAVNRSKIPAEAKDTSYIDVDVTLGDNQLNDNVVNHYNALNQLTETLTKNYKVSFTYDAEGLRTGKTVNGEKTIYVWDGDQVVMELSKGGAVQKRYIRGNDLVYADKGENTEKTYYVTDMHGNVVQLLDESGNVTKTYEYDSFGNEVKPEKKDENPYRYCGEYYDKETEEVYLRARYYQPSVGRFITRDTYTGESDEPLSLHLYTYCANDGVNAWDPSGHCYKNGKWKRCKKVYHKKYKPLKYNKNLKYYKKMVEYVGKIKKKRRKTSELERFVATYKKEQRKKKKSRYNQISKATNLPPLLIAAIHYRESTTDYFNRKFSVHLHNGDPLGKVTKNYPEGICYYDFVKAGIDAFESMDSFDERRKNLKLTKKSKDIYAMLTIAWFHNGAEINIKSSYIFNKTGLSCTFYPTDGKKGKKNEKDKNYGVFRVLDYALWKGVR